MLCTSSRLCGRYSPLPKTADPFNRTNEDTLDRGNLFLFQSTQYTTPATQIPNGKSQLAVVDAGYHFISPWYMHMDLPCRVAGQRPKINFDRKWISETNQPDTDQQQLYTNLWLNRTLYTPKHHRTTTIISIIEAIACTRTT